MTIFERVRAVGLPEGQYVVFGSGLLEAFGIRRAKDVDLVVSPELYDRLKTDGWVEVQGENAVTLNRGDVEIGLAPEYVPSSTGIKPDEVLNDPLEIEGLAFVRPEYLIVCKRVYNKPKHLRDAELLDAYLAEHPEWRK